MIYQAEIEPKISDPKSYINYTDYTLGLPPPSNSHHQGCSIFSRESL